MLLQFPRFHHRCHSYDLFDFYWVMGEFGYFFLFPFGCGIALLWCIYNKFLSWIEVRWPSFWLVIEWSKFYRQISQWCYFVNEVLNYINLLIKFWRKYWKIYFQDKLNLANWNKFYGPQISFWHVSVCFHLLRTIYSTV